MNRTIPSTALATALLAATYALPALAAVPLDGAIDTSFGTNGRTVVGFDTAPTSPLDIALDTLVDSFGRTYVIGVVTTTDGQRIGITRLRADGDLDVNYGPDDVGLVVAPEQLGFSLTGVSGAIDAQGRLLVGGTLNSNGNEDFAVCRFTVDGALTAFPNGFQCVKVAFDVGGADKDVLRDITIQADGRIVMVGSAHDSIGRDVAAIARLDANGNLDSSFNGNGRRVLENGFGYSTSTLHAVTIAANGKIVAVGEGASNLTAPSEAFAARILTNGLQDNVFGLGGVSPVLRNSGREARFDDVVLAPGTDPSADPRVVAVGKVESSAGSGAFDGLIARYQASGSIDPTFSDDGVQVDGIGSNLEFSGVHREANGSLTVVGTIRANSNPATTFDFYATRFLANGDRDIAAFNSGAGYRLVDFLQPGGSDTANAVAFHDDRVIIAGATLVSAGPPANLDFAVVALARDRLFANGFD